MSELEHYRLVEHLFQSAMDHGTAFLDSPCAGDPALRAEVESLLASYATWSAEVQAIPEPDLPRFGPYTCDSVLGTGGMGTVYRAHRDDGQFTQDVAIKALRGSLRSEWFRERFLSERQILARLNHPHIARLLDGGTTSDGEPYLAMELVEGEPIDAYCIRLQLSTEKRIALFRQVLIAVDYAHRNLVVHRDLKPANILVTAEGQVKLLDFGTSRLIEEDTGATLHRALTPGYSSPEQLRGQPLTTATDVFSLGVILYELLSGESPFGKENSGLLAMRRAVEDVHARPLPRRTFGDLTNILDKALAIEPERRYASVHEFAQDLERYQTGQPVVARPNTAGYRAYKFIQRRPKLVGLSVLAVLVLLGSTAYIAFQAAQLRKELAINRQLLDYTISVFRQATPAQFDSSNRVNFKSITVAEALRRVSESLLPGALAPEVEVPLRFWFQAVQYQLGSHELARKHVEAIRAVAKTPAHQAVVDYLDCRDAVDRRESRKAVPVCEAALRYLDAHPDAELPWRAGVLSSLATAAVLRAENQLAEHLAREAYEWSERRFGPTHYATMITLPRWAAVLRLNGKSADAESALKKLLAIQQSFPVPPIETTDTLVGLGRIYGSRPGRTGETEAFEEAEHVLRRYVPEGVLCTDNHRQLLAARARNQADSTAAGEMERVIAGCPPANDFDRYTLLVTYGETLVAAGRLADAERELRRALQTAHVATRRGNGFICWAERHLANVLILRNTNLDEARKLLIASRAEYLQVYGPNNNVSVQRIDKVLADLEKRLP